MSESLFGRPVSRRSFLRTGAALGVAGAAAPVLAGCGSAGGSSTTLRVAFFGTQQAAAQVQASVVGPFEAAHPGVKVRFDATGGTDWNDFFGRVLIGIVSGRVPDIATVATEGLQLFAEKGLAYPLDDFVRRDAVELKPYFADVHPALVEAMMYQGHLFELPTDFNAGNMFYATSLFKKAGLEAPAADWTRDDFFNIAQKIKATSSGVVPYDWVVRLWGSWTSWMYANDANLLTEGKWPGGEWLWRTFYPGVAAAQGRRGGWRWGEPTANSPGTVEALDYMIQLKKAGLAPQPDVGGGGTLQGLFSSQKIAMSIGGGFWAGGLHNAGMPPGSFDVQFFPKWRSQRHLFGTNGYGIFARSKKKELAWEFLKSIITPTAINGLIPGNSSTPTRKSMMTAKRYSTTGPEHWRVFYDTLTDLPDTAPIPAPPYYNALANALNTRTTQAMSSGNAKGALDGLQGDLELASKRSV